MIIIQFQSFFFSFFIYTIIEFKGTIALGKNIVLQKNESSIKVGTKKKMYERRYNGLCLIQPKYKIGIRDTR